MKFITMFTRDCYWTLPNQMDFILHPWSAELNSNLLNHVPKGKHYFCLLNNGTCMPIMHFPDQDWHKDNRGVECGSQSQQSTLHKSSGCHVPPDANLNKSGKLLICSKHIYKDEHGVMSSACLLSLIDSCFAYSSTL